MKTKKTIRIIILFLAVMVFNLTGCKKEEDPDTSSLQQLSKDQGLVETSSNDILNEINDVLSSGSDKNFKGLPCNVTIDSSSVVNDTINYSITFNGANCSNTYTRYGNATVKKNINTSWGTTETKVIINYINIDITKTATEKTVILNGMRTFENLTGDYLFNLGTSVNSVSHKITGQLEVEFEDNTTVSWSVNRKRTFTGAPGELVVTNAGLGSADSYSNLVWWGTNRQSELFYTETTQEVVHKQICDWKPTSGIILHRVPSANKSATITFGYDNDNQPISGNNCPVKLKLDWEKDDFSGTVFLLLP